jgi:Bacterial dnaA protein helix-turn-helix
MSLAMPGSRAELLAHYAAVRARLAPQPTPPAGHGTAWHLDAAADAATRIRAAAAILAVIALEQSSPTTIGQIRQAVCRTFGVTRAEIESPARADRFVAPRQIGMTLARRMTGHSLPEIGRRFGRRDHSTVRHAVAKWDAAVARALAPEASHRPAEPGSAGVKSGVETARYCRRPPSEDRPCNRTPTATP